MRTPRVVIFYSHMVMAYGGRERKDSAGVFGIAVRIAAVRYLYKGRYRCLQAANGQPRGKENAVDTRMA
jgi:hypothetical protein